jgi:hypothetical protein
MKETVKTIEMGRKRVAEHYLFYETGRDLDCQMGHTSAVNSKAGQKSLGSIRA